MFKNILAAVGAGFICFQIYDYGRNRAAKDAKARMEADAAADKRASERAANKPAT